MTHTDQGFSIIDGVFTPADMRQALHGLAVADLDRTKAAARQISHHAYSVLASRHLNC